MQTEFQKELKFLNDIVALEFNKMHRKSTLEVAYHYTDAKGLMGILEDKEIYLTQANYLNDSSELIHGWKIIKEIMRRQIENNSTENPIVQFLTQLVNDGNLINNNCDVFITSFCEEPDLLNQWRGYGSTDGAFSIGFKTNNLEIKKTLFKVEYDENKQKNILKIYLVI